MGIGYREDLGIEFELPKPLKEKLYLQDVIDDLMVGNAVLPNLAYVLAKSIKEQLEEVMKETSLQKVS